MVVGRGVMEKEEKEIFYKFDTRPNKNTKILSCLIFGIMITLIVYQYPYFILYLIFEPLYLIVILLFLILVALIFIIDKNKRGK